MNEENKRKIPRIIIWTTSYMCLIPILYFSLLYLMYLKSFSFITIYITAAAVVCLSAILYRFKLNKPIVYIHDILNIIGSLSVGIFLSYYLVRSIAAFFVYIVYVIVVDVISFTPKGKNMPNAKLISNVNTLSRLSICLPISGQKGLYPIIGIGDLIFYSTLTLVTITKWGADYFIYTFIIIVLGSIINAVYYMLNYNKSWYKGIPATFSVGILYLISIVWIAI